MSVQAFANTLHFTWGFYALQQYLTQHIILYLCVFPRRAALYEHEKEPAYWDAQASATLDAALKLHPRKYQAKNIILFLGDGRSFHHYGTYSSK